MEEGLAVEDQRPTVLKDNEQHKDTTTIVEDDWSTDPRNPYRWTKTRKTATVLLVSSIGFVCTMGSSIYAPGREQVASDFKVSEEASILPVSLYNVGMGLGPLIASPLSETFGRRAVYLVVLPVFSLFVLGSGFSSNLTNLSICRLFAGIFASPSVAIAAATIADMYGPSERAIPLIIYYSTPTLGALSGPLIGALVVNKHDWHWTAWTTLFFAVPIFLPILLTKESYRKVLLARWRGNGAASIVSVPSYLSIVRFITQHLGRPLHMLMTEPIVSALCLYMSFQFGLLYAFVISSPTIYANTYHFSLTSQGLSFLGLISGTIFASLFLATLELRYYRPRAATIAQPEDRLHAAMVGSLCLPIGLFIFAFTARPDIHWIVPMIAQAIVTFGSLTIYVPAGMYLIASYGAKYGASASGANSLLRYALASTFPLFTSRMFSQLGTDGATSLLGGCTVLMAGIPWVLRRWGGMLRRRSAYVNDE